MDKIKIEKPRIFMICPSPSYADPSWVFPVAELVFKEDGSVDWLRSNHMPDFSELKKLISEVEEKLAKNYDVFGRTVERG